MITAKMRIAILRKATANLTAIQICEEINNEVGRVSYGSVLKVIRAAGIDLTAAASERLKRLQADAQYAAANGECMRRLRRNPNFAARQAASERRTRQHANPEFEAKRIAGICKAAKAKRLHPT